MRISFMTAALIAAATTSAASATTYVDRATFLAAVPGASVVDTFESGTAKSVVLSSFTTSFAKYTGLAGVPTSNVFLAISSQTNFGLGGAAVGSTVLVANGDEWIRIEPGTSVQAIGFDVFLNDLGPAFMKFYSGDVLIDEINFIDDNDFHNNRTFAGIVSAVAIDRIEFKSTLGGTLNTGVDNVTALAALPGVPEPASWATMISGLALAGAALRRRIARVRAFA